jgi:UDP-2,4-diacetamido-2,4,6-trideoxy-beta-L-altropyranose hydrolase
MNAAGRAVFVTHGGAQIGLGHVKRCLALAKALESEGAAVSFIVTPDTGTARFIEWAGFTVRQHTWEREPMALCAAIGQPGVETVIVDAYTARTEHFEALRPLAAQVVAIDDTAERRLPVHVVVNVGAETENLAYQVPASTMLLLGSRYALLDPAYGKEPGRPARARVERVLVTLGGSVHADALWAAVAAVDTALDGVRVDVAIGPFGSAGALVGAVIPGKNRVVPYGTMPDLRPLMLEADLAVMGAGVTLYEIAATATPAVMVMTAPNQARNVEAFERAGAALFAGSASAPDIRVKVETAVVQLASDPVLRARLGAAGRKLVDGEGARRVARELVSLPSPRR